MDSLLRSLLEEHSSIRFDERAALIHAARQGRLDWLDWSATAVRDWLQPVTEEARKRAEQERQVILEEWKRAEPERKRAEEERKRAEEEWKRAEEERQRQQVEARQRAEEERKRAEEERQRQQVEARKRAEEERKRAEEERKRAEEERKRAEEERKRHVNLAAAALAIDYVSPEPHARDDRGLADIPNTIWLQARTAFVQEWSKRDLEIDLDAEQAAAVGSLERDLKVVARAGSGKTRVLFARTLFLQQVLGVRPDEILMLVFNVKARKEIEERLGQHATGQHVMTFHALAYSLLHDGKALIRDSNEGPAQTNVVEDAINAMLGDEDGLRRFRGLMDVYFREDLERFDEMGLGKDVATGLAERYQLPQESLRGETVKSYGEKWIANTLFEFDVQYAYEAAHEWDDSTYRPDFTLWKQKVAIEYFGMAGDPAYDAQSDAKRTYWSRRDDWTLIEVHRDEVGGPQNADSLIARLEDAGVKSRRLTDDEIWTRCRSHVLKTFQTVIKQIIDRAKAEGVGPEELIKRGDARGTEVDKKVAAAAAEVLRRYGAICDARDLEDHADQIWRASEKILSLDTKLRRKQGEESLDLARVKHVLIDELQDFTEGFRAVVSSIQAVGTDVSVFGVGDDWQAINRFAGANPDLFTDNEGPISRGKRMTIRTNYRSTRGIVEAGNHLMAGSGTPAVAASREPARVQVVYRDDVVIRPSEVEAFDGDRAKAALLRIISDRTSRGESVTLLARTKSALVANQSGALVRHLGGFLSAQEQGLLRDSTVHAYKGQESDVVVLLDVRARRYPLIHPHWIFTRILGDTINSVEDDERRLFYVGVTRGQKETILMSEREDRSKYLVSLDEKGLVTELDINAMPTPDGLGGDKECLRVSNGYEIKERLKERGFRWDSKAREWWIRVGSADLPREEAWLREIGATFQRGERTPETNGTDGGAGAGDRWGEGIPF